MSSLIKAVQTGLGRGAGYRTFFSHHRVIQVAICRYLAKHVRRLCSLPTSVNSCAGDGRVPSPLLLQVCSQGRCVGDVTRLRTSSSIFWTCVKLCNAFRKPNLLPYPDQVLVYFGACTIINNIRRPLRSMNALLWKFSLWTPTARA